MGEKGGAGQGAIGTTTPTSEQAPVAEAPVLDEVVFIPEPVAREPFVKYPVKAGKKLRIAYRYRYEDGDHLGSFEFTGARRSVTHYIDRRLLKKLRSLQIWVEPYGAAALLDKTSGKLALGRLTIDMKAFEGVENPSHRCKRYRLWFEVLEGVAQFIVDEMNTNKTHADLAECRELNAKYRRRFHESVASDPRLRGRIDSEAHSAHSLAKQIFARKVHTRADLAAFPGSLKEAKGVLTGLAASAYFIGGGEWDHKPIIEHVWGARNRLGDREYDYFYDIWSNIHYGYVGRAAGFDLETLKTGASQQQKVDSGAPDEAVDGETIEAGYHLHRPDADVTLEQVIAVVEGKSDWRFEARKAAWDKK